MYAPNQILNMLQDAIDIFKKTDFILLFASCVLNTMQLMPAIFVFFIFADKGIPVSSFMHLMALAPFDLYFQVFSIAGIISYFLYFVMHHIRLGKASFFAPGILATVMTVIYLAV